MNREPAVLIHVDFSDTKTHEELQEFQELSLSAGAEPAAVYTVSRKAPDAKYFIGSGKAETIRDFIQAESIQLVLVNHTLTPSQERNLEHFFKCRVLDRIGLILDIFAQRARTFEGRLQVELAQLQHLSTRLVRGWTHLERQKGGIGLRGPGEKQLETDRRLITERIKTLTTRLDKVRRQREQGRRARRKAVVPTVSLVGYTNAGKSTLFNRLTNAEVYVADQLFATLDPTLRGLQIPHLGRIVLADTVGFIRHLPHDLVESFKATLEESRQADLLLHIVDAHEQSRRDQVKQVNRILDDIGAGDVPQLFVFNKVDLTEHEEACIERDKAGRIRRVWLSAVTGEGIDLLHEAIAECLSGVIVSKVVHLEPKDAKLRASLYALECVISERIDEQGDFFLSIRLPKREYDHLFRPSF